jgi:hypothetical protein
MATGRPGDSGDPQSTRAGEVLETLRRLRGWTVTEFSQKAGVTRTTFYAKRSGGKAWTLADTARFAEVLGVPEAVFLMDDDAFWLWWNVNGREP